MARHIFEAEFHIGQTVAFRLDPDEVGLVTCVSFRDGAVTYSVTWANRQETAHHEFELRAAVEAYRRADDP